MNKTKLFTSIFLLQPAEDRKRQRRESKSQLMADIGALANQTRNRANIPGNLHSQRSTKEAKAKSANRAPAEWQEVVLVPGVIVVARPAAATEDQMLFCDHHDMNDGPV